MGIGTFAISSGGTPGYLYVTSINSNGGDAPNGGSLTFTGLTGTVDVSSAGWFAGSSFGFMATSTWSDGVGPSGTIVGTGWVNLAPIPAPGALALLGLAGITSRRRRK